jgi:hypothetical protein
MPSGREIGQRAETNEFVIAIVSTGQDCAWCIVSKIVIVMGHAKGERESIGGERDGLDIVNVSTLQDRAL